MAIPLLDRLLKRSRKTLRALRKAFFEPPAPLVHVVKLTGTIGSGAPLSTALTLESVAEVLEAAFEAGKPKAVALIINSPGGAAAQSMLIHARIRALAAESKLPVYAFAEDVAASGGYMIACAADEIYATESSIVGSIGVVAATFGFEKLIEKLGIERRLFTAGQRKALLDPFLPVNGEDVERLKTVQQGIHEAFKALVRAARGARLMGAEGELFSGEFWTGGRAAALGLIDGIGDVRGVLRGKFGADVRLRLIEPERRWRWRRAGAVRARRAALDPAALIEHGLAALEARAIWARFGL